MGRENIAQRIREKLKNIPEEFKDMKEAYCLDTVIAERKAFLSKQRLSYIARFKVDETAKEVTFTERLKESRSGLGAGDPDDTGPGLSFKKNTVSSGVDGLEGIVDQQSTLFGKKYDYSFDYKLVRSTVREVATSEGYSFTYKIWGKL